QEVLRTRFVVREGRAVQEIAERMELPLVLVDLTALDSSAQAEEIKRLSQEWALQPFDLSQGPLWRVALLALGNCEQVLLLTMHHIISDGWSMGVLTRELALLYEAFAEGQASPLAELPIQYADFAQWQRRW